MLGGLGKRDDQYDMFGGWLAINACPDPEAPERNS
jgi:hypothetical protein